MNRLTASILALGLAASVGTASAQSSGYYSGYGQPTYGQTAYGQSSYGYGQPTVDRYGQRNGAYYDYATVLRVDPVIQSGYGNGYRTADNRRCYNSDDEAGSNGYYDNGYSSNGYPNNGYSNNGYSSNGYYGNQGYGNQGYGNQGYGNQGSSTGRTVATVIGGVLGAALGSQVGGGSARYATSAIGSLVGGIAGQQVYENSQRARYPQRLGHVQVCDPVSVDSNGYSSNGGYGRSQYGQYGQYGQASNNRVSGYNVTYEYGGRTYSTRTNYNPGNRIRVRVNVDPS